MASLDDYRMAPTTTGAGPTALVIGYGNLTDQAVPTAVQRLAHALDTVRGRTSGR
ncbi:hypothetical protein [Streptomyces pratensis]|uniref:hypothetical protein n=1 Tax=Streptomyces pratensis TaxID=1169025 RepID=UPI0030178023